jgi:outer membrane protein TolC
MADCLQALDADARALKAALLAEQSAKRSLGIAKRQLELGQISLPTVLAAEQAYQQADIGLVQAEAGRYADTVALYAAVGGGWWRRDDLHG